MSMNSITSIILILIITDDLYAFQSASTLLRCIFLPFLFHADIWFASSWCPIGLLIFCSSIDTCKRKETMKVLQNNTLHFYNDSWAFQA